MRKVDSAFCHSFPFLAQEVLLSSRAFDYIARAVLCCVVSCFVLLEALSLKAFPLHNVIKDSCCQHKQAGKLRVFVVSAFVVIMRNWLSM